MTTQRNYTESAASGGHTGGGGAGSSASSTGAGAASSSSGAGTGGAGTGGAGAQCAVPGSPVDCSDPACVAAGYSCTPDVPMGWKGPAALYTGPAAPPGCGIYWTQQPVIGGFGVNAPPAQCGACTCGAPSGLGCGSAPVEFSQSSGCQGGFNSVGNFGQCGTVPFVPSGGVLAGPVPGVGGTCTAGGGAPMVSTPTFNTQAALCAVPGATGSGCSAGACVPQAPAGYGSSLCIYQDGDVACPPGPYSLVKTTLYTSFADSRSCGACSCGVPAGATCPANVLVFFDPVSPGCQQPGPSLPANGACAPFGGPSVSGYILLQNGPPKGGACAPGLAKPLGNASGAKPVTVCCT